MGQKNTLFKIFGVTCLSLAVFFVYQITFAFTAPTCNPPNCTGTLGSTANTGLLGIGTTAPTSQLQVSSTTAQTVSMVIERGDMYKAAVLRFNTVGAGSDWAVGLLNGADAISNGWGISKTNYVSGAKLFLSDSTFNLGIGTTNPAYKLDVVGDVNFTGNLYDTGVLFTGSKWTTSVSNIYYNAGAVGIGTSGLDDTNFKLTVGGSLVANGNSGLKAETYSATQPAGYFNNGSTGPALVTGTGNVGIGTTNPTSKLELAVGNAAAIEMSYNGTYPHLIGIQSNPGLMWFNVADSASTNARVMTLTQAGNVGIGTTNPGAKLSVYNSTIDYNGYAKPSTVLNLGANTNSANGGPSVDFNIIFNGSGEATGPTAGWLGGRIAGVYDTGVAMGGALTFYTNSGTAGAGGANSANVTEKMRISPSGNVGIGTTAPSQKLEVVGGSIKATGGFILETRSTDPGSPVAGQMWVRTDL